MKCVYLGSVCVCVYVRDKSFSGRCMGDMGRPESVIGMLPPYDSRHELDRG